MAYSTSNPPEKLAGNGPTGVQLWYYKHTDIHTDVDADDYFSNGKALGMRVNDLVLVIKTDATIGATLHVVTAVATAATVAPAILA